MKKSFAFVIITILMGLSQTAFAFVETVPHKTHLFHIGADLSFAWDEVDDAEWYEVKGYHYEQEELIGKSTWKVSATFITIKYPRFGHFIWQVRACKTNPADLKTSLCSEWSKTNDPTKAKGGDPWWTYGFLASPGGGGIK